MQTQQHRAGAWSPLAAFRRDVRRQPMLDATREEQGAWIIVSSLLDQSLAVAQPDRLGLFDRAAALVVDVVGEADVAPTLAADPPFADAPRQLAIARVFVRRMEEAGALHLADACSQTLQAVWPLSVLDDGRLLSWRARIAWKLGEV